MARNSRKFSPTDDQGGQPDREIDEEDPAPTRRHQNPADERPERRRVTVYTDYKSPYAYLAKDLTYELERGLAVRVEWRGERLGGMMNQGPRPTFGIAARALEIHLFDFAGDLYGESVRVEWVRRLRDVQAFPSREALVQQLERDRVAAQQTLNL